MNTLTQGNRIGRLVHNLGLAAVGAALLLGATAAFADDPVAMAPPVASAGQDGGAANATPDSIFNWTDVPQNQRVPVDHATFDRGGYQIYDTSGETIVIPFKNDDLYVMKFARSDDDSMYFINRGDAPVLYVPDGGYLDNATVSGARWYPFPQNYHPTEAVYVGPAPSWDLFIGMGWYPGMRFYGGYWCGTPFWDGGVFVAFPGLFFDIGGHSYWGWDSYHSYCGGHPGWFRPGFYNRDIYHWAGRPSLARPPFGSVAHPGFAGGGGHFGSSSAFRGTGHFGSGGTGEFHGSTSGGYHTFRGADAGSEHSFSGGGSHSFSGGSEHSFSGGSSHSFGGGSSGGHSFGGGSGGGHTFHGSDHSDDHGGH